MKDLITYLLSVPHQKRFSLFLECKGIYNKIVHRC